MGACYCTGRCRLPGGTCPAQPQPTAPVGWICPRCGNVNSPNSTRCQSCPISTPPPSPWRQPHVPLRPSPMIPETRPHTTCDCNGVCKGGLACPHRVIVTYVSPE